MIGFGNLTKTNWWAIGKWISKKALYTHQGTIEQLYRMYLKKRERRMKIKWNKKGTVQYVLSILSSAIVKVSILFILFIKWKGNLIESLLPRSKIIATHKSNLKLKQKHEKNQ